MIKREELYLKADNVLGLLYKYELGEIENPNFLDDYFECKFLEPQKGEDKIMKVKRMERRAIIEILRRDEMIEMEIGFKMVGDIKISDKGIVFLIEGGYKTIMEQEKINEVPFPQIILPNKNVEEDKKKS